MSVQYKLQYANIGKLQDQFQQGYEAKYANYIEQVVRETVGNFTGTAFWTNRKDSGDLLKQVANERLQSAFADVENLQILNVALTAKREQSLINTQVTMQQGKTKIKEQTAREIRSQITIIETDAQKNITQIQGNASATAKLILAEATSNATQMTINATASAYKQLDT